MPKINQTTILGRWRAGYALDLHSINSVFDGYDQYGHPRFQTTRTAMGELLYRLKYGHDTSVVEVIARAASRFVRSWGPSVDRLVAVPATRQRREQPVVLVAEALAKKLGLPFDRGCVTKGAGFPEVKDVHGRDQRTQLLAGAFEVKVHMTRDTRILLFDDLFRSGATMNAVAAALYDDGGASEVFSLALTRTGRNR